MKTRMLVLAALLAQATATCQVCAAGWHEWLKVTASDAAAEDDFGASVAISGAVAVIGAPGNDDAGSNSGSAYLFNPTTGEQLFKLTADDASGVGGFGDSVGISGNTAIVGAPGSHSAYLFDVTTGEQLHKLTAPWLLREHLPEAWAMWPVSPSFPPRTSLLEVKEG